jgi:EAL domain-containing protein (putative c-di-GMP-specific phosphodiesterase class I)/GGDEF domain-containing protein
MSPPIPSNEPRQSVLPHSGRVDMPLEPVFDRLTRLAAKSLGAPMALICLANGPRQWLKSSFGMARSEVPSDDLLRAHALVDDILVISDLTQNRCFSDKAWVTGHPHVRFYSGISLRTTEGPVLGTLGVMATRPRPGLSPKQTGVLRDLAGVALALIEAHQAAHAPHPVTGLPGRAQFLDDVKEVLGASAKGNAETAVLIIEAATPNQYADLVRTLGHDAADLFEIATANRAGELLPEDVGLYHLATARFGCVLTVDAAGSVAAFVEDLADQLQRPVRSHDIPLATSVGIGVAHFPRDGTDAVSLLRAAATAADEALDNEKSWCAYSPMRDLASRRASYLLRDIGPALANTGQLHLVYQPKVDLRTTRCIGAEALLRWTHPSLGLIGPNEFVRLVERTTLVHALTDWALGAALSQVARWRQAGLDVRVSINVSILDLVDEHFRARLESLLDHHEVRPDWIGIEVTESVLMKDPVRVGRLLDEVRRLGVAIEIDDFGTGQSTLSYLKYIPATHVKIDQLFISRLASDRNDQIMVRSTINLVHELGHLVVAEGTNDTMTIDWLRQHGCDVGQGDAISPPLDAPSFERWLRTRISA